MNLPLALLSLSSVVFVIVLGIVKPKVNIGIVAIGLSFLIGIVFAGLTEKSVIALFPTNLFIMLVGVTLFFGVAENNGLLEQLASRSVRLIKGKVSLIPIMFFIFAFILSAIGPGNIAATAILAPLGMGLAYRFSISQLLVAIMIVTGANAGAFSPIAPTGVILHGLVEPLHITNAAIYMQIFVTATLLQSTSAVLAYFIFKGFRASQKQNAIEINLNIKKFTARQILTLFAIFGLLISIIIFKVPLAMATFVGSAIMLIVGLADTEEVVKKVPWDTIILVTGVSLLIGIMDKAGGLELATTIIAQSSFASFINSLLTFITGAVSAYSSSSGVVMPAFIPLVPRIIEKLGTGNPTEMLIAISVGSHMVDASPLSTLGALCIASAIGIKKKLFNQLLIWGLSMMLFATFLSFIFLDLL